jgi:hypothetical protein
MEKEAHDGLPGERTTKPLPHPILHSEVTLSEDGLTDEAKGQFGFHTEILRAFQLNARIALSNDRLTPIGRHLFCTSTERSYTNCKEVLSYVAAHPKVRTTAHTMPPVFFLCGAARTGSTLLYNLLACDPTCRAPSLLDMMCPVPPLARSDTSAQEQRNVIARTFAEKSKELELVDYERERNASHPSFTYEEDVSILYQSGLLVPHLEPHDSTELANWFYDDTNKDFVYEYHKIFMQMLNSVDAPQSYWLLKTPYHIFNLDTMLRHYPSASLIMTHRRLDDVLPSSIRLGLAFASVYFDNSKHDAAIDRQMVVERRLRATDVQIKRIVKFRRAHPRVSVFDVLYDDLIAAPIDTVRRIYDHFGLAWTEEFEQAMRVWLRDNPQGKQGRNTYTLEEFGLTHDEIEQQYEDYNRMFLNLPAPLEVHGNKMKSASSAPD